MRSLLLLSAAALGIAFASPASANHGHGYQQGSQNFGGIDPRCASEQRTSRNVGGFLGALGGASAGRALAAAAVRPEGVILGTVVGAVIGASLGNAAVDCSPRALYTQEGGRSYGHTGQNQPRFAPQAGHQHGHSHAPMYQAPANYAPVYQPPPQPVYQAPVHHAPVYQAPVYQAPAHHAPVHHAPVHHAPVYHAPVYHAQAVVDGGHWYQPSPQSYYGQERRGPLVAAPTAYDRPASVPQDSYVASAQTQGTTVVTQSYYAGWYHSGQVMVAPVGAPCGFQVCR